MTTAQRLFPTLAIVMCILEMFMEFQNIDRIKDLIFQLFCLLFLQIEPVRIGVRQYGCPYCNRIMKSQRDMKRHIMVHTGEKPISCDYCEFTCNSQGSMSRHIQNRHARNPLEIE